jgi:hypothetical protein
MPDTQAVGRPIRCPAPSVIAWATLIVTLFLGICLALALAYWTLDVVLRQGGTLAQSTEISGKLGG